jgi:hypothetical protein
MDCYPRAAFVPQLSWAIFLTPRATRIVSELNGWLPFAPRSRLVSYPLSHDGVKPKSIGFDSRRIELIHPHDELIHEIVWNLPFQVGICAFALLSLTNNVAEG